MASEVSRQERIKREQQAYDVGDIEERTNRILRVFSHVRNSPYCKRMEFDLAKGLSNTEGMQVLELGCGRGEDIFPPLEAGAHLDGIDISMTSIEDSISVAARAGYGADRCRFQVMDAHKLEFPDNHFDVAYGSGILHHLDFRVALEEIFRVLKPGGCALFMEPLGGNPLLKLYRFLTPNIRTPDETPLFERDLRWIEDHWIVKSGYYGLTATPTAMVTSLVAPGWPDNWVLRAADWIDRRVLNVRILRSWHQHVLFHLVKP